MRPTAFIVIHPTRLVCTEAQLYIRQALPTADASLLKRMSTEITSVAGSPGDFAQMMDSLWSAITKAPGWQVRAHLDAYPHLLRFIEEGRQWLREKVYREETLVLMAAPDLAFKLRRLGYNLVFFEGDYQTMSADEILVCNPRSTDGICGEWRLCPIPREKVGVVIEGVSIPA